MLVDVMDLTSQLEASVPSRKAARGRDPPVGTIYASLPEDCERKRRKGRYLLQAVSLWAGKFHLPTPISAGCDEYHRVRLQKNVRFCA